MFDVIEDDRAVILRLNSPPKNILTSAMQEDVAAELKRLRGSRGHNVLLIASALDDFSAGADVAEHIGRENCERMLRAAHGLIAEVLAHNVPVIACLRGICLGGALELALACDFMIAEPTARLGLPEIRLGCYPPASLVIGQAKLPSSLLSEMVLGGQVLNAAELAALGAGVRIVPDVTVEMEALCRRYSGLPRGPLEESVRILRCGAAQRFEAAIGGIERAYLERLLAMPDATEGPQAFLSKRQPRWDHKGA